MKYIIEFGIIILLMGIVTNQLPSILKKVRHRQFIILREASTSNWGRVWVPPVNIK